MRRPEHARLRDAGELVDARLDFLRKELEPGHEDDGLLPAVQEQRAVVELADVAREKPAVTRDLLAKPPGLVVGGEEAGAPHADLARRAGAQALAVVGEHGDLVARYDASDRARRQIRKARIDAGKAGLDDAVGLTDTN